MSECVANVAQESVDHISRAVGTGLDDMMQVAFGAWHTHDTPSKCVMRAERVDEVPVAKRRQYVQLAFTHLTLVCIASGIHNPSFCESGAVTGGEPWQPHDLSDEKKSGAAKHSPGGMCDLCDMPGDIQEFQWVQPRFEVSAPPIARAGTFALIEAAWGLYPRCEPCAPCAPRAVYVKDPLRYRVGMCHNALHDGQCPYMQKCQWAHHIFEVDLGLIARAEICALLHRAWRPTLERWRAINEKRRLSLLNGSCVEIRVIMQLLQNTHEKAPQMGDWAMPLDQDKKAIMVKLMASDDAKFKDLDDEIIMRITCTTKCTQRNATKALLVVLGYTMRSDEIRDIFAW